MPDTDDYRPGGLTRWWSRTNPVSATWVSLLCLAAAGWLAVRYAQGAGTVWTLATQICVLATFAASSWCRYGIARGSSARKLLVLLPILLLLAAGAFYRHGLAQRGKTSEPDRARTSIRPAATSSAPARGAAK